MQVPGQPLPALFYVVGHAGQMFGPVDLAGLSQWVLQGQVQENTPVKVTMTAQIVEARLIPGLPFSISVPDPAGQIPVYIPAQLQSNYPRSSQGIGTSLHSNASPDAQEDLRRGMICGWCGLGLFIIPIVGFVLSTLAIYFGHQAKRDGLEEGRRPMIMGGIGIALNSLIGVLVDILLDYRG